VSEGRERGGAAAAVFEDAEHDSAKSIQALQQMTVAIQNVVGSSPIIRSDKSSAFAGVC